eukprot:Pgem_evm1s848
MKVVVGFITLFSVTTAANFPLSLPSLPKLNQLSPPPRTPKYPVMPGHLFDDSQIIKIDIITDTEPKTDKQYVNSKIRIETLEKSFENDNMLTRLAGDNALEKPIKSYYFKTKEGQNDFFGEWDRFSIKKSMLDNTLCREKIGSDLGIALGYLPRYVGYSSVTLNGKYLGIYTTMQRMEKQWIERTFGPNPKTGKERGSHYKAKNGNLGDINSLSDITNIFSVKFANKKQNDIDVPGLGSGLTTPQPGKDLLAFANVINSLKNKKTLSENEKTNLRNMIDYENYARAQVLDYYSSDDDGYFFKQQANYEWYHDVEDNKWKVLRWDLDDGFQWPLYSADRMYTMTNTKTGKSVPALTVLLKDSKYVELYRNLLFNTAKKILPAYNGKGDKPAYVQRIETFYSYVVPLDKAVYDRTVCAKGETCVQTVAQLTTLSTGIINGISARTNQVLTEAKKQNWKTSNVGSTTITTTTSSTTSTTTTTTSTTTTSKTTLVPALVTTTSVALPSHEMVPVEKLQPIPVHNIPWDASN